jgi:hypothetical protein
MTPPPSMSSEQALKRFQWLLISVIASWFVLVYAYRSGDFWPFSKFPMFSRAGRPWTLGLVRELNAEELAQPLVEVDEERLPGRPYPLGRHHMNQDDLSAVIKPMLKAVEPQHGDLLKRYFRARRSDQTLVLYSAQGTLLRKREIEIRFRPLAVIGPDGVRFPSAAELAPP